MITALLDLYQKNLGYDDFYDDLRGRSQPGEYNEDTRFLEGYAKHPRARWNPEYLAAETTEQPLRIDVPVWYGDPSSSRKVIVFGREPRDTNDDFVVCSSSDNKRRYAAPFGADRWNLSSSVSRKPHLRYLKAFNPLLSAPATFILFSDVVKYYDDDPNANRFFITRADDEMNKELVREEIRTVSPSFIVAVGRDVQQWFSAKGIIDGYKVEAVRHPSHGGAEECEKQLQHLMVKYQFT